MRGMTLAMLVLASQVLSGCVTDVVMAAANAGQTEETIRTKTAAHFGTSERNVRIANFKNQLLGITYQAKVRGTLYNCRYYQLSVNCGRPGAGTP